MEDDNDGGGGDGGGGDDDNATGERRRKRAKREKQDNKGDGGTRLRYSKGNIFCSDELGTMLQDPSSISNWNAFYNGNPFRTVTGKNQFSNNGASAMLGTHEDAFSDLVQSDTKGFTARVLWTATRSSHHVFDPHGSYLTCRPLIFLTMIINVVDYNYSGNCTTSHGV